MSKYGCHGVQMSNCGFRENEVKYSMCVFVFVFVFVFFVFIFCINYY